jgi:2-amino-4-hydroxy-6-hydroxymethyldihydropteridine diphosphokinase
MYSIKWQKIKSKQPPEYLRYLNIFIMNKGYLLTGSNLGDREQYLAKARELINKECGYIVAASSIYETAAWGKSEQPDFLNQALEIDTDLLAIQLMHRILNVEKKMGRIRGEKYGPRIIDIDILFFNDEKHNSKLLKLPHPDLQNRRFALLPLSEIAPDKIHPVLNKTIAQLLKNCPDKLDVKKF